MSFAIQVVFDCEDPDRLATFWAELLGYTLQPPPAGYDSWEALLEELGVPESEWGRASAIVDEEGGGPRFYFQKVPESKSGKNRLHVDVNVSGGPAVPLDRRKENVEHAMRRAEGLGARFLYRMEESGGFHITLADPEGNEFCLH